MFISASAGNRFTSYQEPGLSYPAASPYVVPVMSVDQNGNLSSFSQRHARAIAAPGRSIVSTVPDYVGNHNGVDDDYESRSGTSQAAPYIAGASMLVREALKLAGFESVTQQMIYDHLMATSIGVYDPITDQTYQRLHVGAAIDAILIPGDFNRDGRVDAADYVVWRKGLGSNYDQDDLLVWRSNFGNVRYIQAVAAVPEPAGCFAAIPLCYWCVASRPVRARRTCAANKLL
jgi:hypothetical protein